MTFAAVNRFVVAYSPPTATNNTNINKLPAHVYQKGACQIHPGRCVPVMSHTWLSCFVSEGLPLYGELGLSGYKTKPGKCACLIRAGQ